VRVAADGEIEVAGRAFCGYLGAPQSSGAWIKTGDIGAIDSAGFISVSGRRKNVLVTTFGRNIAPEWPEALLTEQPAIAQAAVFGDDRPYLVALLVVSSASISDATLAAAVDAANRDLPDYARIGGWVRADQAFTAANGLATAHGRVCREAVRARYAQVLDEQYAMVRPA
jgi:long-subunit acyl-CoA synthetase (AMP-forming)